jgi:hypothetical protein
VPDPEPINPQKNVILNFPPVKLGDLSFLLVGGVVKEKK